MPDDDSLAQKRHVVPDDLRIRSCILFERHVQPQLYDEIISTLQPASRPGCSLHNVKTAEDALQMVFRGLGVAMLTHAGAWRIQRNGLQLDLSTRGA